MTTADAKKLVASFLDARGLAYEKLTARTVNLDDLARARPIFVTVHGWTPNPAASELVSLAVANGFRVQFRGEGFVS